MPFSRTSSASFESKAARDSCSDPGLLGRVRAAADLVEQGGGGTSDAALVPVLGRQIAANEIRESRAAGPQSAVPRRLRP